MAPDSSLLESICGQFANPRFPAGFPAGGLSDNALVGPSAVSCAPLVRLRPFADERQLFSSAKDSPGFAGAASGRGRRGGPGSSVVLLAGARWRASADSERRPRSRRLIGFTIYAGRSAE